MEASKQTTGTPQVWCWYTLLGHQQIDILHDVYKHFILAMLDTISPPINLPRDFHRNFGLVLGLLENRTGRADCIVIG